MKKLSKCQCQLNNLLSAIWWFGFPSVSHGMSCVSEGLETHDELPDKAEGYK